MRVVRTRTRFLVQTRHRFEVVIHDVRRCGIQNAERAVQTTTEIGRQNFNARVRRQLARLTDTFDEVRRAAVAQIVTIHARDHHVLELQRGNSAREICRLFRIERVRAAVPHVAERAATCALVAHDHERGRALTKAFADVRAARFLTHRMQIVLAQNLFDFVEARIAGRRLDANPVRFFSFSIGTILIGMRAVLACAFCFAVAS